MGLKKYWIIKLKLFTGFRAKLSDSKTTAIYANKTYDHYNG